MVIPRIFHRCLHGISSFRIKPLETDAKKRLFLNKNKNFTLKTICRNFSAYDSDGQTIGIILNKKNSEELLIRSFNSTSFFMPGGEELVGSMIIFPHSILTWNISSAKEVTEESLVLFKLLEPKIDILVFGYGNHWDFTPDVKENFAKCCKKIGIRFEALPTVYAVGTYNFLASERRLVAAALIPPKHIDVLRFDRSKKPLLEDGEDDDDDEEEFKSIDDGRSGKKLIK